MIFVIKSAIAPMFDNACSDSQMVDEALHGMAVTIEDVQGEWAYVLTGYRYKGWVKKTHLAPYKPISGDIRYINTFAADILAAPKVQAPLLLCLTLGCTVHKLEEMESGWSNVALADGRTGYIRTAFLSPFPKEASRSQICKTAKLYLNTQYRWGGKTPYGIDCSGLTFMAYYLNGINIYRDARIVPGFPIKEISPSDAREGDLLFFPGHVGIFLDKDTMIHSSEAASGVKIEQPKTAPTKAGNLLASIF